MKQSSVQGGALTFRRPWRVAWISEERCCALICYPALPVYVIRTSIKQGSSVPSSKSSKNESWSGLVWIAVAIIGVQAVAGGLIYTLNIGWPERGQFGDMFGAVNTLFSGLAFASLIYALRLQRRDLNLQRRELEMTRSELARSATAQAEAAATAARVEKLQLESMELTILTNKIQSAAAVSQALMAYQPKAERQSYGHGDSEYLNVTNKIRSLNSEIQSDYIELSKIVSDRKATA